MKIVRNIILWAVLAITVAAPRWVSAQNSRVPWHWQNKWWNSYLEQAMLPIYLTFQPNVDIVGESTSLSLAPMLISPLQSKQPIAPTQWDYRNDTLIFLQSQLGLRIVLAYNNADSSFAGVFRQGMYKAHQVFSSVDSLYTFPRPQTPEEPFNFVEEPFKVSRTDRQGRTVVLEGTLTLPKPVLGDELSKKRTYPAVLLVSGSGQQDRNEELFLHQPFLVVANYLASQGYAVLRYDDRGIGGSVGDVEEATTLDFADDAEALFNQLRKHPRIDAQRVSIMGHSEGGTIAAIVASRNRKVHSMVMLSGTACKGDEVLLQQNEALFLASGVSPQLVEVRVATMREIFEAASRIDPGRYHEVFTSIVDKHVASLGHDQRDSIGFGKGYAYSLVQQMKMPWMRTFLSIDPMAYLSKVRCPVTAFFNERDIQVLAQPNALRMQSVPTAVVVLNQGLNHMFQHCSECTVKEYAYIEETFAPEVLQLLVPALEGTLRNQAPLQR